MPRCALDFPVFVIVTAILLFGSGANDCPGQAVKSAAVIGPAQPLTPQQLQAQRAAVLAQNPAGAAAAPTAQNLRLARFLTLQFDRTPSAILKAWAEKDDRARKAEEKKNKAAAEPNPPTTNDAPANSQIPTNNAAPANSAPSNPQPPTASDPNSNASQPSQTAQPSAAQLAAEKQAADAQRQAEAAAKQAAEIEEEINDLSFNVTLGQWTLVGEYLARFDKPEEFKQAYEYLLQGLAQPRPMPNGQPVNGVSIENQISPDDLLQLAAIGPKPLEMKHATLLASLLALSVRTGHDINEFLTKLKKNDYVIGGTDVSKKVLAAEVLIGAGHYREAAEFLPDPDSEESRRNPEHLSLLTRYFATVYSSERKPKLLEQAWEINNVILALPDLPEEIRNESLTRAIDLSTRIREEIGQQWLIESFTKVPERGMQIIANIGSAASQNLLTQFRQPEQRLAILKLQNPAVRALIESAPELAGQWKETLTLLASNWLKEAELTNRKTQNTSLGAIMQVDMYGNYFYTTQDEYMQRYNRNSQEPMEIDVRELLPLRPDESWLAHISASRRSQFFGMYARLFLRVNEEEEAFPFIEQLAPEHPEQARDLVHEFLQAWTRNHDPNSDRRNRNRYIYMYGFEQKADGIPLTRSKQERNLVELEGWVERIRKLPIEPVDESLLSSAFTTSHSMAEVYRLDSFESVFGSVDTLKPETIYGLVETMRSKLSESWRSVRLQEENRTNRKQPELEQEVLRGYAVARQLVDNAQRANPAQWQLQVAKASLMHDENDYAQSVQKRSEYSAIRGQAFAEFRKACDFYRQAIPNLEAEKQSTAAYDYWFYAALGAVDLGKVSEENVADDRQFQAIRQAILDLPGESADSHLEKFANNLFTRMSPIKPQVKHRYLKGGMAIVGDHKRAWEAKKLFDYYNDLLNEIQLVTEIDGSDRIHPDEPFGVFVSLLHTPEIERESAGFGKYVQNQNNLMYAYNYGRPTENYREKFEKSVGEILSEHFEVKSIIFEDPKNMQSSSTGKDGWRLTPYAYLLLKPKGEQVDMIPPVKLDLDFLDTSGYAILPVESPTVRIDVNATNSKLRPASEIKVTQTLDERQAADGKLILEIKATATGLVPNLNELLDLKAEGFEIESVDDQGVVPTEFAKEGNPLQVVSDRSWTVHYVASDKDKSPKEFTFLPTKLDAVENKFQRYDDADLVAVDRTVPLSERYARSNWVSLTLIIGGAFVGLVVLAAGVWLLVRRQPVIVSNYSLPTEYNPFTVLGLLRQIRDDQSSVASNHVRSKMKQQDLQSLSECIEQLESHYFGQTNGHAQPDLERLARTWVSRAS